MGSRSRATRDEIIGSVEAVLQAEYPDVELVDADVAEGRAATVTLFIDRPGGVDLDLCSAVTGSLDRLRERFALQVSSPGLDRPLRTAAHYEKAVGEKVYVKTSVPVAGRSVFRGVLVGTSLDAIELRLDEGSAIAMSRDAIAKAHVIFDFESNGGQRE
jgi:ribosome maturation factor RimP